MSINSYDIDGVIYLGGDFKGLRPEPDDVIITGRSYEEYAETSRFLESRGIKNQVFYNKKRFDEKTRETSGIHKAGVLNALARSDRKISIHFEDDPVQARIIRELAPDVIVVEVQSNLVNLENERKP